MSKKIVIVDDSVYMAQNIGDILSCEGFDVKTYYDPRTALHLILAEKEKIGIVVVDYNMPYMNGVELSKALRNGKYANPIIMLTTEIDEDRRREAHEAGVAHYYCKNTFIQDLHAKRAKGRSSSNLESIL